MLERKGEELSRLYEQFVIAVRESIARHCAGVLKVIPAEEINRLEEEDLVLILEQYVSADVLPLGLEFMCWKGVMDTVHRSVEGVIEQQRRRMNEQGNEGDNG